MKRTFEPLLGHFFLILDEDRPKGVVYARPTLPTGRSAAYSGPPGVRGQLGYPIRERGSAFELMKPRLRCQNSLKDRFSTQFRCLGALYGTYRLLHGPVWFTWDERVTVVPDTRAGERV